MGRIQERNDHAIALRLAIEEYRSVAGADETPLGDRLTHLAVTAQADALAFFAGANPPPVPVATRPRPRLLPRPASPGFGGLVDLRGRHESEDTWYRLSAIDRDFFIVKAKGNGDCAYNAFLGTLVHTLRHLSPGAVLEAERRLESLPCERLRGYAELVEHKEPVARAVRDGYGALTTLVRVLAREASAETRLRRVQNFCHGPHFADAVAYLRARTAHAQLSDENSDYATVCKYVWNNTLQPSRYASQWELNYLAASLGCTLAVMNPRESDRPSISPTSQDGPSPWGQLNLLCWAESEPGTDYHAGHYDGLMPRYFTA